MYRYFYREWERSEITEHGNRHIKYSNVRFNYELSAIMVFNKIDRLKINSFIILILVLIGQLRNS